MFFLRRPTMITLLAAALVVTGLAAYLFRDGARRAPRDRREAVEEPDSPVSRPPREGSAPSERPRTRAVAARTYPIEGVVRDEGGRPVAGAAVRATSRDGGREFVTAADAEGRYRVEPDEPVVAFDVLAEGFLPLIGTENGRSNGRRDFVCEGDGVSRCDFRLRSAASLQGRVVDETGAAVPRATVYVISPEHSVLDVVHAGNVVATDRDGWFSFTGLPEGVYDLGARASEHLPALVRDVAVGRNGRVTKSITLRRGRTLTVRVHNAGPTTRVRASDPRLRTTLLPPGGIEALVQGLVGREYADLALVDVALEKPDETLVLGGLPPGPIDVAALDPSRVTEDGLGRLLDFEGDPAELTLLDGLYVAVRAVDAVTRRDLEPRVARNVEGQTRLHPVDRGDKGLYLVPQDERRQSLVFDLEGYERTTVPIERGRTAYEVEMQPVAEGETGAFVLVFEPALENGRVALVGRDARGVHAWTRHLERPDDKGRWVVAGVPVGEYAVTVLASGMIPVQLPRVVVTGTFRETHRIQILPGGGLAFRVTDTEGNLLDKVGLELKDAAGARVDLHILTHVSEGRAFLSINYVPSAASARADSGLAAGAYTLTAYRDGYLPGSVGFVVQTNDVAEVNVVLSPR